MTRSVVLAAAFACAALSTPLTGQADNGAALRLHFAELRPQGAVSVALFADEAGWRSHNGARSVVREVRSGDAEVVFTGLQPGRYGVMAYHDRNADGRLNTLPIGLPTEPYGFSNNARGAFGPPGWRQASFTVAEGEAVQTIRLR